MSPDFNVFYVIFLQATIWLGIFPWHWGVVQQVL